MNNDPMTIQEVYYDKVSIIEKGMTDLYKKFERAIEKDKDYYLCDDEVSELFDELIIMYMQKTMTGNEFDRVTNEAKKL